MSGDLFEQSDLSLHLSLAFYLVCACVVERGGVVTQFYLPRCGIIFIPLEICFLSKI